MLIYAFILIQPRVHVIKRCDSIFTKTM